MTEDTKRNDLDDDLDRGLSKLRAEWLQLPRERIPFIHGWLLGVACAIERKHRIPFKLADNLIDELRNSSGPPIEP